MTQQQRTYPQGVTSWVDIEQRDVDGALAFYGAVLGWTFHQASPPGAPRYVIAQIDGLDVAGVGEGTDEPGWHTYVAVDDIDAVLDRITAAGGAVTTGPTVAGEGGTWAGFTDPQGVPLRLWQPKRRLGAQLVNAPGAWNFSDLRSDEPATSFYTRGVRVGVRRPRLRHDDPRARLRRPPRGHHRRGHPGASGRSLRAPRVRGRDRLGSPRRRERGTALARDVRRRRPRPDRRAGHRARRHVLAGEDTPWALRRRSGTRRARCSPGASSLPRSEPDLPGRRGT